jgi:diguanylate cyclase (GGDEF)-like protein
MNRLGDLLQDVNVVAFCVLALACAHRWHKRNDASIRWATLAFGSLALVGVIGFALRSSPTTQFAPWFVKIILVVLVLFPLFLYRFATAFQRPSRLVALTAHASTALVVIASLLLPELPRPGAPHPGWWSAYRVGILGQWTILFSIVAARLWVSARGEATVVRCRMRTLALAAAGLNAAVLLSGVGASVRTETMVVVTQGLMLVSALLFFAGLAPPGWLVQIWRRPEQLAFQGAMGALFRAEDQAELSAVLLPRAAGLVGARAAALVSPSNEVLATHGSVEAELQALEDAEPSGPPPPGLHRVELRAATLLLWTSPYAPFFGPDEFAMTESLGVFSDIVIDRCTLADQQRRAEAALTYQATHDKLTGLPNRALLEERVTQALARSAGDNRVAVLFLDVDRFKVINDSLGHAVGDQLLMVLARKLQSNMRPHDTIARFGGDEFVIVTDDWAAPDAPERLANRIAESLKAPLCLDGTSIVATVSIGVAVATGGDDAGSLLRDADAAMYQAKEQGRDRWVLFDAAMREAATLRLETENALRRALDDGELRVHYQPLVDLVSGRATGVEALVRWQDGDTLVLPKGFIPVAEETGLIIQLGATVLREACRQVAAWRREIPELAELTLSVNLSARQILNPGIVDQVREALDSCGLDPSVLCLEITESVLLDDTESCARSLQALNVLGVRVAVDDFGTGYSSLTYLKRLAVDTLKIDQSFVAGLTRGTSTSDRAIVAGIIDLAHAFGLTTVAEGVETAEQVAQLNALGCRLAQGYHFCRPLPPDDAASWMRAREARADRPTEVPVPEVPDRTRVLVVDDQCAVRNLLRWTIEFAPELHLVGEAADGREAVALARHHQPDLVILDLAMPGVGGLEALPLIRAVAPRARVVVLSGLDPADVEDMARDEGAAGYLCKDGDPDRLLAELHRVLEVGAGLEPPEAHDRSRQVHARA